MNLSISLKSQLLATKFYAPVALGHLILRPRLTALLNESLKRPFTLVSAPAGFGKTTLLSAWKQSLPAGNSRVAWVSLDEEDNDPWLFWTYVLTALDRQQPDHFTALLMLLQSPQAPPLKYVLAVLINQLVEETDHFLLILDDYQMITEKEVHMTLAYLIEHLPPQLRIIVATRADPPLPLPLLRAHQQTLEVRTDQLRCTAEETRAFFDEVVDVQLPDETIQQVTARTEGWLVGLHLLSLSLSERADPLTLLQEISGDQRDILDYLTEVVLGQQPLEVQTFLLSTSILEQLNASLCDAVMEQAGSQHMLQRLEQTNLFVVSLDSKRQWYRYHALFAEALRHQLEWTQSDLVPILHHRASLWYAQHDQTTQAILHAFRAKEWQWAADLMGRYPLLSLSVDASKHELIRFRQWLEQLPADIIRSRPGLCLACIKLLWVITPYPMLKTWFDAAEATLTASLTAQANKDDSHTILTPQVRQEQENLLGEVIGFRAYLLSFGEEGHAALPLCEQSLSLLSIENGILRSQVGMAQLIASYSSSANDAVAAIQSGHESSLAAQAVGIPGLVIGAMTTTATHMIGTGRLHETWRYIQQAVLLGRQLGGPQLPYVGWPLAFQAEILREWNELDAARALVEEAISLCKQTRSKLTSTYIVCGYVVLVRICLSRGELDAAYSALEELEYTGRSMDQPMYLHVRSLFTTIDQIRLWLAFGELNRATHWAEELDVRYQYGAPFAHEREEVGRARVLLAQSLPVLALQRLELVLQRATKGQRWGHVIEIRLLQALAYHMHHEVPQALDALSEAVRLAEPEGYIRSFVDEGTPMEALFYQLRKRDGKQRPTPYLDTLLSAFQQESMARAQAGEPTKAQPLPEPLSERELQVLQLLARGASNLEIAQELVIVVDTVKRHVSHIFSKLGVQNRIQAVKQSRELNLLDEER